MSPRTAVTPKPTPVDISTTAAKLEPVNIRAMRVSEIAQRELSEAWVDEILSDWHAEQVGYLDVSFRDGVYWIVDGQHRHAALMRKYPNEEGVRVMARVYRGLTETEEAELFLKLNNQLKISAMDKFDKSVVAGRTAEVEVNEIVKAAGMQVAQGTKSGHLQAVGTLVHIYQDHGSVVLKDTLNVLVNSFGDTGIFAGLLRGMSSFLARYPEADQVRLIEKLSSLRGGMNALRTRSELLHKQTGRPKQQCVSAVIVDVYNAGKGGKKLPAWFK